MLIAINTLKFVQKSSESGSFYWKKVYLKLNNAIISGNTYPRLIIQIESNKSDPKLLFSE